MKRRHPLLSIAVGCALFLLLLSSSADAKGKAAKQGDAGLFNAAMYEDPGAGETQSKGERLVFHEGEGEMPTKGYFKKHEPGEVAEFHLFVPAGLDPKRRYPLLIVYHGGKDGASGKGLCGGMARLSTKEHPVLVLSPNMYTMDAYKELLASGTYPIDSSRVVVYGHSSGGMGVLSAMREFLRSKGAFTPAALISSSTTASLGRGPYPPTPYIVMAGEKETPDYVKHKLLKNRRSTCRRHALSMQRSMREVRYIEMKGHGHGAGKAEHRAVLRNLLRALPSNDVKLRTSKVPEGLATVVAAARRAEWGRVQTEMETLDESSKWKSTIAWKTLRKRIRKALLAWYGEQVALVGRLKSKSKTFEIQRGFRIYDNLERLQILFEDTAEQDALDALFARFEKMKFWQAELEARRRYDEIVRQAPSDEMKQALEALRNELPTTEYGFHRTREKLLALQG